MPVTSSSNNCPKAAISVSEMASRCSLSRARFYDLMKLGVFPQPCHDLRTRRPFFPAELQETCLAIRRTNTGFDGRYVVFNNRHAASMPSGKPCQHSIRKKPEAPAAASDPRLSLLVDGLAALGITVDLATVQDAVGACYPSGLGETPVENVIRTVFRHLRRSNAA